MSKIYLRGLFAFFTLFLFVVNVFSQQCPTVTRINTELKYETKTIRAWRYGNIATIALVPGMNVNVDGSPRAYSVGSRGLSAIHNGVNILGEDGKYHECKDNYVDANGNGCGKLWLEAEQGNFALGTPQFHTFALVRDPSIPDNDPKFNLIGNGKGKPLTQKVEGEAIEYYVSTTSVTQNDGSSPTEQRHYLDAGEIPAFVVPGKPEQPRNPTAPRIPIDPLTQLLGKKQMAWSYYPTTEKSIYSVVGDTGPPRKFSEASIAFHLLLRFGRVTPIPNRIANLGENGRYENCSLETFLTNGSCLYRPFYQRNYTETQNGPRIYENRIKVENLGQTIFVFFDKDKILNPPKFTNEIIQEKGKGLMSSTFGDENKLKSCLKQRIPELTNLIQ